MLRRSAMRKYFNRDFKAALATFERMLREDPDDVVPRLFAERCIRHLRERPPPDWNGFDQLSQK
jgi:cytochrome c-type biogenesis protein CcmH/NrfG